MTEINGKARMPPVTEALQAQLNDIGTRLGAVADEFVTISRVVNQKPSNVSWMSNSKHVIIVAPVALTQEILRRIAGGESPEVTFRGTSSGEGSADS